MRAVAAAMACARQDLRVRISSTCGIHTEGRREGGREQYMQVHTPTCSSKSPTPF